MMLNHQPKEGEVFLKFIPMILVVMLFAATPRAEAFVFISEILADPALGLAGDANGDGISSSNDDEFIELYNPNNLTVDLSGWSLSDALRARHVFPAGSFLSAYQFIVVFGSTASTGTLSLNNTGDTVTLFNFSGNIIDQVTFGAEAGQDQAIVRMSDGTWKKTTQFSPGYSLENLQEQSVSTPEPSTMLSLMIGMIALVSRYLFSTRLCFN